MTLSSQRLAEGGPKGIAEGFAGALFEGFAVGAFFEDGEHGGAGAGHGGSASFGLAEEPRLNGGEEEVFFEDGALEGIFDADPAEGLRGFESRV